MSIDARQLISLAKLLVGENNIGAPSQARLRRAVSTAYYALFHALVRASTDDLIGKKHRRTPRYETIYRGFEHRQMRSGCEDVDKATMSAKAQKAMGLATAAQELRDVANTFVTLQKRRHWADYSPTGKITRAEVRDLVDLAEFSISQLVAANTEQRRNFLAFLMMSTRE